MFGWPFEGVGEAGLDWAENGLDALSEFRVWAEKQNRRTAE